MILTIGHTKGGVGKSTLAINIAAARMMAGREVWLVDGDRQRTSQKAMSIRSTLEGVPGIPCDWYVDGETMMSQVRLQAHKFDDVIIECGGGDTTALRTAMALADAMLVPFPPRSVDVWAFDEFVKLVSEVRATGKQLPVYAVLNMADPGVLASDNTEAIAALENYPQLEYLPKPIVRRKAYANAAGSGVSVFEFQPQDPKAIAELNALISAVF